MYDHPMIFRVSHAITVAGKCALIFLPVLFLFLATIFMIRGDGTAPAITHLAAGIIEFTEELLGVSSAGSLYAVLFFWPLVVFAVSFPVALLFSSVQPIPADPWTSLWALGIALIVIGAVTFLIRAHEPEPEPVDERALAVEFVRNNAGVMQMVGGRAEVDFLGYSQVRSEPATYEIAVYGSRTIYAFVQVSEGSAAPGFRLLCTTPLGFGQRDPIKHACEQ